MKLMTSTQHIEQSRLIDPVNNAENYSHSARVTPARTRAQHLPHLCLLHVTHRAVTLCKPLGSAFLASGPSTHAAAVVEPAASVRRRAHAHETGGVHARRWRPAEAWRGRSRATGRETNREITARWARWLRWWCLEDVRGVVETWGVAGHVRIETGERSACGRERRLHRGEVWRGPGVLLVLRWDLHRR